MFIGCIDNLLYTVHIGCESCNNDTALFVVVENATDRLAHSSLRLGKTRALCIRTFTEKCQYTFLSKFCETNQVDHLTKYRCIVNLKITGMHNNTGRCINSQCRSICDTVICLDKFDSKTAEINGLSMSDNLSLCCLHHIMFF